MNDLWDKPLRFNVRSFEVRILDFELTQVRAFGGLYLLLGGALGLMVLRGIWAAVYSSIAAKPRQVIVIVVTALTVLANVALGVLVGLEMFDWWFWVIALSLTLLQFLAFRAEWGTGLATLGVTALISTAILVVTASTGFSGANVQISFALLAIVSLLSTEWLCRKVMRLA